MSDFELEGTGDNCPECGSKVVELLGQGGAKLCSNGKCGWEVEYPLKEGQKPLINNNRAK